MTNTVNTQDLDTVNGIDVTTSAFQINTVPAIDITTSAFQAPSIGVVDLTQSLFQAEYVPPQDLTGPLYQLPEGTTDQMYAKVIPLDVSRLTTGPGGKGAFDVIMASLAAQLLGEYNNNRITGGEYTKAYIELTQSALQMAVQFVLGSDQAFWAAQTAQIAAITGRIQMESARFNYQNTAPIAAANARVELEAARYNTQNTLPIQSASARIAMETGRYSYQNLLSAQAVKATLDMESSRFTYQNILPAQFAMVAEQGNQARAQTSNTRLDGSAVVGVMGAQEALYEQQIVSYKRDAEVKAAKLFSDTWITQATIVDGLPVPPCFSNDSINEAFTVIMANNGFGTPEA